jgi:probable HAF family extracellular repeat protein
MLRWSIALFALGTILISPLTGEVRFEILDLNDLNDTVVAIPFSINNAGVITGTSDLDNPGRSMATVWIDGRAIALGIVPGDHASEGVATNLSGQTVGHSLLFQHIHDLIFIFSTGVLYENGGVTELESMIQSGENWELLGISDINDHGQIIGTGRDLDTEIPVSFLFDEGILTELGTLGGFSTSPYALNNAGRIVGQSWTSGGQNHAFLWVDGAMTDLGTFGGRDSRALDINELEQIVGGSQSNTSPELAVLWENGEAIELGTLGGNQSNANGINNMRQIVGFSTDVEFNAHMFFWEDGEMINPLDFIPPGGGWGGRANALDINDAGQFVGTAYRTGVGDAPAVLTPVELELTGPFPGVAGEMNRFDIAGIMPGERVHLVYGGSVGMTPIPGCPGATILISGPRIGGSSTADGSGFAQIDVFVPGKASGRTLRVQAIQGSGCLESNVVTATFD